MPCERTDGTVQNVPDCDTHQRLGRASGGRGEGTSLQIRKISLVKLGTHIEFAFADDGWKDAEQKRVELPWNSIPDDALLMPQRLTGTPF